MGATGYGADFNGRAYLFYGGGGAFNVIADGTMTGSPFEQRGIALAIANTAGDAWSDVLVGSYGSVYVYYGWSTFNTVADAVLQDGSVQDFGTSMN